MKIWGTKGITTEEIRMIIRSEVLPLQTNIGDLSKIVRSLETDQVTRGDLNQLRVDMNTGFSHLDNRYYSRELTDEKFKEVQMLLKSHDDQLKAIDIQKIQKDQKIFTLSQNVVFWIFSGFTGLLGTISIILQVIKHP